MKHYPGILNKDSDSDFGVSFPDFPGCIGVGDTNQEAIDNAFVALKEHMELRIEAGEPIPEPSDIDVVRLHSEAGDVIVMVPAPRVAARAVRANVTMPEDELAAFDVFATQQGFTRSGLFLVATRLFIKATVERTSAMPERPTEASNVHVLYHETGGGRG